MTSIPSLMSLQDLHCANMNRRSNPRNRACRPAQFGAAYYGPNGPAAVQRQHCEQLPDPVVQGLRNALSTAISEIKSLKEENTALKEQIALLENRQVEVSQLQEELKQKDDLLKRAVKKRRARTRAHIETLALLGQLEKKHELREEQWKSTCDGLVLSIMSKNLQLQKKQKKEDEEKHMKEEEEKKSKKEQEEKTVKENEKKRKMKREEREKVKKEGKAKTEKMEAEKIEKEEKETMPKHPKEKVQNKEREKVEKETKRSEEEETNEKKVKKANKRRGKKKEEQGCTVRRRKLLLV